MKTEKNQKEIIAVKDLLAAKVAVKEEPAVLVFLRKNPNNAYMAKALVKITKTNKWTIFSILKRLVKQKLVVRDAPYYYFARNNKK